MAPPLPNLRLCLSLSLLFLALPNTVVVEGGISSVADDGQAAPSLSVADTGNHDDGGGDDADIDITCVASSNSDSSSASSCGKNDIASSLSASSNVTAARADAGGNSDFKRYGLDLSFPTHSLDNFGGADENGTTATNDNPFGDIARLRYQEYMRGCNEHYKKMRESELPPECQHAAADDDDGTKKDGHEEATASYGGSQYGEQDPCQIANENHCAEAERKRIEKNHRRSVSMRNYTALGFQKMRVPQRLFDAALDFWQSNKDNWKLVSLEDVVLYNETWNVPNCNHWVNNPEFLQVDTHRRSGRNRQLARETNQRIRPDSSARLERRRRQKERRQRREQQQQQLQEGGEQTQAQQLAEEEVVVEEEEIDHRDASSSRFNHLTWIAFAETKHIVEEWAGVKVQPSITFGMRVYKDGQIFVTHTDELELTFGVELTVAQDLENDEDWPLEVYGHDGLAYNVTIRPGEMALVETAAAVHGRPFPMKGRHYVSLMIVFSALEPPKKNLAAVAKEEVADAATGDAPATTGPKALWQEESNEMWFDETWKDGRMVHFKGFPPYLVPDSPEAQLWKKEFVNKIRSEERRLARRQARRPPRGGGGAARRRARKERLKQEKQQAEEQKASGQEQ